MLCNEQAPQLLARVEKAKHDNVRHDDDHEEVGGGSNAIDAWVQKGDWHKVLKAAEQQGPQAFGKYLTMRCKNLCDLNDLGGAIEAMDNYGVPVVDAIFPVLQRVATSLLGCNLEMHGTPKYVTSVEKLRSVLFQFVKDMQSSRTGIPSHTVKTFETLLLTAHYFKCIFAAKNHHLPDLAARMSISLLRFIKILPSDKLFYLAGMDCRARKWLSPAFVYLNRYLDLSDAMLEDGDADLLDNSDFEKTDIPSPADFDLPEIQYITEDDKRDEVRDWVMAESMDQANEQQLPQVNCKTCDVPMYEASLECLSCQNKNEACIITGYPVPRTGVVHCTECNAVADRESWNAWTRAFAACAWCEKPQRMSY